MAARWRGCFTLYCYMYSENFEFPSSHVDWSKNMVATSRAVFPYMAKVNKISSKSIWPVFCRINLTDNIGLGYFTCGSEALLVLLGF